MSTRRLVAPAAFAVLLAASAPFMTGCAAQATRAPTVAGAPRLDDGAAPDEGGVSAPVGEEKKSARKAIAAIERAIMKNDWATAKAYAEEAIAADPKSVRALYYAGLCAEKLDKPADAEALYRRALAVDPTFPEAAINLSAALIEADKVKEAVAVILPAAKAWPSDLLLQENLGLAAALGKSHETAIRAFQKLEKAGVLHTETRITYADSLLATGKRAEALVVLKAGLKQVADNEAEVLPYATLLLGAGAPEEAKTLVERVIKTAARSGGLHVLRGRAKLALNDAQGAALDFDFALKLEPNDAAATFALAEARDVLGQRAEAKKAFTAALKLGLEGENAEKAKKRLEQITPLGGYTNRDSLGPGGRGISRPADVERVGSELLDARPASEKAWGMRAAPPLSTTLVALAAITSLLACGADDDAGLGLGSATGGTGGRAPGGAGGTASTAGAGGAAAAGAGGSAAEGGTGAKGGAAGKGGTASGGNGTGGTGAGGESGKGGSNGEAGKGGSGVGPQLGDVPATCVAAVAARGNLGCSFRAVDLPNEPASPTGPGAAKEAWGLLLGNPGTSEATVAITRLGADGQTETIANETVPPGGSAEVSLASYEVNGVEAGAVGASARSTHSIRVVSDVPIGVVQLNTLAPAFSSDGAVLFPESALGSTYVVAGWPAANGYLPPVKIPGVPDHAYVTIVGGDDPVEVSVTPTFAIAAAPNVSGAMAKTKVSYTLGPWEVLHLATAELPAPKGAAEPVDLTGTIIEASAPVAVFSGNERASVANVAGLPQPPGGDATSTCCTDHLEEQLMPSDALGTRFVVAKSPLRSKNGFVEGDLIRFVGGPEQTIVTTNSPAFPSFVLPKHGVQDIVIVADLVVEAKAGIMVAQLLASKDETSTGLGDPALTLVAPETAFLRRQVAVLPQQKWAQMYVTLVAEEGTTFTADGAALTGCVKRPSFGLSDEAKKYVSLSCQLVGTKLLEGSAPFGATAYGYDDTSSFAYALTSGLGGEAP